MTTTIDLSDFNRAMAKLAALLSDQVTQQIAAEAAEPLEAEAKRIVAAEFYDTGETYRSIETVPIEGGARVQGSTEQLIYGEFGTVNMAPVAPMRRAADATGKEVVERMEQEVKRRVFST